MKDPEKKTFYDKYGTEEEFREKYAQQHQGHYHEDEEMDPFDLFEMFFTAGMGGGNQFTRRGNRVFRRRQQPEDQEADNQRRVVRNPRYVIFMQLLPFLVFMLFSIIPYLFNTVTNISLIY